jgi:hypothetical protein
MNQPPDITDSFPVGAAKPAGISESKALPPSGLGDIPGLGPIRIRALQKAGFGSLPALRSAPLEALLAVPGLTEIKAKHIQQYLQPFSPQELEPPVEAPALPANIPPASSAKQEKAGANTSSYLTDSAAQLIHGSTRALGEVITLLLSPEAPQFRSRLLKALGQFAQRAESLAIDAVYLTQEQQERAYRRLRRAGKELVDFTGQSDTDRKAQGRLADSLEEINGKLADCILTSPQK